MDSTTVGIIGALATALAGLAGWFSKQGMDAYRKYREEKRTDTKFEDDRRDHEDAKEEKTLLQIISRQDGELLGLRSEIKEMRADHRSELRTVHEQRNECQKQLSALQAEVRIRWETMGTRVDKVEQCQVETNKVVQQHHDEKIKSDSTLRLEVITPKLILPDGSELDCNDPEVAALIEKKKTRDASKREHDERNRE